MATKKRYSDINKAIKEAEAGKATAQNGAPAASDSGDDSAHDAREPMPVRGYGEGM